MKKIITLIFLLIGLNTTYLAFHKPHKNIKLFTGKSLNQIDLLSNYQFDVGKRLNVVLSRDCSLFVGTIQSIQENKVNVLIQDFLSGDTNINNQVQLKY